MATSAQILTDLGTAITTGPTATSDAKSLAAAGPITDTRAMLQNLLVSAKEFKQKTNEVLAALDAGDGIKASIQNIHDTFV